MFDAHGFKIQGIWSFDVVFSKIFVERVLDAPDFTVSLSSNHTLGPVLPLTSLPIASLIGVTTNDQWNDKIKTFPAPWAEVEVPGQIILTVPSSQVRDVTDIEDLAKVYLDIMTWVNRLAGIDRRPRTERFVFDKQISNGKKFKSKS